MNEFEDYYYGYMVPDASYLPYFELHLYDEGFVIQMPEKMRRQSFRLSDHSINYFRF